MKYTRYILSALFSVALAFGFAGCTEQQGPEQPPVDEPTPGRASDLMTLFYQIIEKQDADTPRERVYIVAHRGNTLAAIEQMVPENSLECFEIAIQSGIVDMIEIDVRPTKDGELVIMHDETIDRTTNGKGKVSSYTYQELLKFDMKRDKVSPGVKIPTLKQTFELCKGRIFLNLDIHGKSVPIGQLADLIQECGMMDQVMIYSTQAELVEYPTIDPNFIIHPYVSSLGAATSYKPYFGAVLFQYGLDYDKKSNIGFPAQMRTQDYMTYTNILDHDSKLRKGDYSPLATFVESETDFIQTDVAEIVHEYLEVEGLR
jgi:hypothetical protein